ncbi:glycosyltransferase [Hydrogenophaga sp.]|uniref:glycosyltransferase n=1 Tax=Hydrogenophaga sp. TaxID=1904254 RepID=UPI003F6E7842
MTISIAIATFNGEKYIEALLASLAQQTRLPDEVVVSDDNSTDSTVEKIEHFATAVPFKVTILRSQVRQGVIVNFYKAFQACESDYIAYCDQDDVWDAHKLERCLHALRSNDAALVIHKSVVVDSDLVPLGRILPEVHGTHTIAFPAAPHQIHGFGHQMVFKKTVFAVMAQLYEHSTATQETLCQNFDELIPTVSGMLGPIVFLDEPLVLFRRHAQATSPAGKNMSRPTLQERASAKRKDIDQYLRRITTLLVAVAESKASGRAPLAQVDVQYTTYMNDLVKSLRRRSSIHAGIGLTKAFVAVSALLLRGAYRGKSAGGFGFKNLLADSLAALRVY